MTRKSTRQCECLQESTLLSLLQATAVVIRNACFFRPLFFFLHIFNVSLTRVKKKGALHSLQRAGAGRSRARMERPAEAVGRAPSRKVSVESCYNGVTTVTDW